MAKADNYQSPGTAGKEEKITDPLMTNGNPAHVSQPFHIVLFTNKPGKIYVFIHFLIYFCKRGFFFHHIYIK